MAERNRITRQKKLFHFINVLRQFDGIDVDIFNESMNNFGFYVSSRYKTVPDFQFVWTERYNYFRVYIHLVENGEKTDENCNLICRVGDEIAAAKFITMYEFLYQNRAHAKD